MEEIHYSELANVNSHVLQQIFSNHLIVNSIWKHFDTQDLLRTSLVDLSWCARSREFLKINRKNRPVCIQILPGTPCRQLEKFNEYLEKANYSTTTLRINKNQIPFNGIECRPNPERSFSPKCENCLTDEWTANANNPEMTDPELLQMIRENMLITYGQILEKIKFKYIRVLDQLPLSCPVAQVLKFLLKQRQEDIIELDLEPPLRNGLSFNGSYFQDDNNTIYVPVLLQNLEVFKVRDEYLWMGSGRTNVSIPIAAPFLKIIKHCPYYPVQSSYRFRENYPRHAITEMKTDLSAESVRGTVDFIRDFHPNIEKMVFFQQTRNYATEVVEEVLSYPRLCDIFELGRLIYTTITSLTCPSTYLTFISARYSENGEITRNAFPSLQYLTLGGGLGVDFIDWASEVDFSKDFPKLTKVSFDFHPDTFKTDGVVHGPFNRVENCIWGNISHLTVNPKPRQQQPYSHNSARLGFMPTLLNVFKNVRHLDLSGMTLTCSAHDEAFGEVMSELDNLLLLEEITVELPEHAMRMLCLDHLFLENISAVRDNLAGMNLKDLLLYKASVLSHNSLKQLNITGPPICTIKNNNNDAADDDDNDDDDDDDDETSCHSGQLPGIFLVTSSTAELICKYRPGFKFRVNVFGSHLSECTSNHQKGGFRLEHLETQAKISTAILQRPERCSYLGYKIYNQIIIELGSYD